jgi:predicted enzyme related to lactoylglutathione lyase
MEPFWTTALLDFTPEHYPEAVAHWQRLTDYELSGPVGDHGEFQGLRSPGHPTFLALQRLDSGPDRVHLDLHVADPPAAAEAARAAGATMITDDPKCEVLASPGGFAFCFVDDPASDPAPATTWPEGQRSIADQVCIDIPDDHWDTEVAFWSSITGWQVRHTDDSEFAAMERDPRLPIRILLQRLGEPSGQVRAHIDWATDDREAETLRHQALGSDVVRRTSGWTVMTGPGGTYCITDRIPRT